MPNGTHLALGAAALLAIGAGVARGSGSRGGSGCRECGGPVGGRGSRSVLSEELLAKVEAKRLQRRREQTEFVDPSFYIQRTDAPTWFAAPLDEVKRLRRGRQAFMREQWRQVLQRMGAKRVGFPETASFRPNVVTGRLSARSSRAVIYDAIQRDELHAMGVGKMEMDEAGQIVHLPLSDAADYIATKAKEIKDAPTKTRNPKWMQRYGAAYYAANLLVNRAWTLHLLRRLGHDAPSTRVPLVSVIKGSPGLLGALRYRLVLPAQVPEVAPGAAYDIGSGPTGVKGGQASIVTLNDQGQQVAVFNIGDAGTLGNFAPGRTHVPVLSKTSKMSAPSFSLPAGSLKAAGTCVMAGVEVQAQHPKELMICNSCYATKANYGYAESMSSTHVRLAWVEQVLAEGTFVDAMTASVSCYARFTTEGGYAKEGGSYKPSTRPTQELGVWDAKAGRLRAPRAAQAKAPAYTVVTRITQYATLGLDVKDTSEFYRAQGTPDGAVCGFFRIHDAGDFSVRRHLISYVSGWAEVAARFPFVSFWAPTRIWAKGVRRGRLDAEQGRWLSSGLRNGLRTAPDGSASRLRSIGGRLATRVARKLDQVLPDELRGMPISDLLESHADEVGMGTAASPGEKDAVLLDGAGESTGSSLTYVPNERIVYTLRLAARRAVNLVIRPSSLYVKTPENPAFVPKISGLANGSGVNVMWGSVWAWKGALASEGIVKEGPIKRAIRAWSLEEGHAPDSYVPVFDNAGGQAYQCPVYSLLPVEDARGRPVLDAKGQPKTSEAKSCQAAGCRACWLAPAVPITYGYH
jgi:hypothetical protein